MTIKTNTTQQIDALIWDMDGVLVDVSKSYRVAIRKTAQQFLPHLKVTEEDVSSIKTFVGLNNDWDATYTLIINKSDPLLHVQNIIDGLPDIRKTERYQKIKDVFQSFYLGELLYKQVYGTEPKIRFKQGLIANEIMLITKDQLQTLKRAFKKMGIVTGRPRLEALYALQENNIEEIFDVVITMDDYERGKPYPDGILDAINKLDVQNPVYIGDTLNDVQAAKNAGIKAMYRGDNLIVDYQIKTSEEIIRTLIGTDKSANQVNERSNRNTVKNRNSSQSRDTKETQIDMSLSLDGSGTSTIDTPIGFFNHMLALFSKHGLFDINVKVTGDTYTDDHHTIEDTGIVLGQAFAEAINDKKGINRYGFFVLPMDEALTTVAFDFSGRYSFQLYADFKREKVGDFSTELTYDFWDAFAQNAKANLIIKSEFGRNDHHKIEGIFKATARAVRIACSYDPQALNSIPSTKGKL